MGNTPGEGDVSEDTLHTVKRQAIDVPMGDLVEVEGVLYAPEVAAQMEQEGGEGPKNKVKKILEYVFDPDNWPRGPMG